MRDVDNTSPAIASCSVATAVSAIAKIAVPNFETSYASVSNLGFLFAAFYLLVFSTDVTPDSEVDDAPEPPYVTTTTSTLLCTFLVLLGGSSLSFHSTSKMASAEHHLDLASTWLLLLCVAFVSASSFAHVCIGRKMMLRLHSTLIVAFLSLAAVTVANFEFIRERQVEILVVLGLVSVAGAVGCRIILIGRPYNAPSIVYALLEIASLLFVLYSAVACQGELIGKTLSRDDSPALYDLFHGVWHLLVAYLASILAVRSISALKIVASGFTACVCDVEAIDVAGTSTLTVFAAVALACKELGASESMSNGLVIASSIPLCVHAVYVACFAP